MRAPSFALPLLGGTALAIAVTGAVVAPLLLPQPPLISAQSAVDPTPLPIADDVAQRKAHTRDVAAAAIEASARAQADKARAQQRASRSRRAAAVVSGDPRSIARALLAANGQAGQFSCLDRLWTKESEWRVRATNPSSGAYGIPQSLPASKMASAGSDWRTNPRTQIRWGLGYINERYGSPCAAWSHSQSNNWY